MIQLELDRRNRAAYANHFAKALRSLDHSYHSQREQHVRQQSLARWIGAQQHTVFYDNEIEAGRIVSAIDTDSGHWPEPTAPFESFAEEFRSAINHPNEMRRCQWEVMWHYLNDKVDWTDFGHAPYQRVGQD